MKILVDPYFLSIVAMVGILLQSVPAIYQIYLTKTTFRKNVVISIVQIRRLSDLFIELKGTPIYLKLKEQFYLIFKIKNYGTREIVKKDFIKNLEIDLGSNSIVRDLAILKKPVSSKFPVKYSDSRIIFDKFIINPEDEFLTEAISEKFKFRPFVKGRILGNSELVLIKDRLFFILLFGGISLLMYGFLIFVPLYLSKSHWFYFIYPAISFMCLYVADKSLRKIPIIDYYLTKPPWWKYSENSYLGKVFLLPVGPMAYEMERRQRYSIINNSVILKAKMKKISNTVNA